MAQDKIKVELTGIAASLLGPLWYRAQFSKKYSPLFYDAKAIELFEKIDYDATPFARAVEGAVWLDAMQFMAVARTIHFDNMIRALLKECPAASVVNLGAGLDTTFDRVDNGSVHWYDLDLPPAIEVRQRLMPVPDRVTYIAKSVLDPSWCSEVDAQNGVFMLAGALLCHIREGIEQFFSVLGDRFPQGELVFDAQSKPASVLGAAVAYQLPPDKLKAWKASTLVTYKQLSESSPETFAAMVSSLSTPSRPSSTEYADFETWWEALSAEEMVEALHSFSASYNGIKMGVGLWTLKDARELTKWDAHLRVIDQFPLFKDIPRDPTLSPVIRRFMDYNDRNEEVQVIRVQL